MNKLTNFCLVLLLVGSALVNTSAGLARGSGILPAASSSELVQSDDSVSIFWERFKSAVVKGDKVAVGGLSQFPITMPYGFPTIRTRAQLIKRYREVFNHETSAAKCFGTAQPTIDPSQPREFTVACKNSAGDEVIIYLFKRPGKTWAFTGLDNLNE
jgi:hypothetical protein